MVVCLWLFGTTYRSHLQGLCSLLDCFSFENGTDRWSPNFRRNLPFYTV